MLNNQLLKIFVRLSSELLATRLTLSTCFTENILGEAFEGAKEGLKDAGKAISEKATQAKDAAGKITNPIHRS